MKDRKGVGTGVGIHPHDELVGVRAMLMSACPSMSRPKNRGAALLFGLAWETRAFTGQYCNESQPVGLDKLLIKPRMNRSGQPGSQGRTNHTKNTRIPMGILG